MLTTLPPITFPITSKQVGGLMDCVQQLNVVDAGLDPRRQHNLDILLHLHELYADTHGQLDYRSPDGHRRLVQDSITFVPEQLVTKHGDLRAAHLAINFNNAQAKLKRRGYPMLSYDVNELINQCRDFEAFPLGTEQRISLMLNYLAKKTA